ncbi:MAG: hypothetical protein RLZZ200_3061 [Pseudomonadota bacterium]
MVQEIADFYSQDVEEIAATFAPFRPWWSAGLTFPQQVWRWSQVRDDIMSWLMEVGVHMGFESAADVLAHLEDVFTSPALEDMVPPSLLVDERADTLKEMVQASGPKDTANHIRKMEKGIQGQLEARAMLANKDQPDIPEPLAPKQGDNPPAPAPVELMPGTSGPPNFGLAPKDSAPAFTG